MLSPGPNGNSARFANSGARGALLLYLILPPAAPGSRASQSAGGKAPLGATKVGSTIELIASSMPPKILLMVLFICIHDLATISPDIFQGIRKGRNSGNGNLPCQYGLQVSSHTTPPARSEE